MKICTVFLILVVAMKTNGDEPDETTTQLFQFANSSEDSYQSEESSTEESESITLSYERQAQLNGYNDELDRILNEKLDNYTKLKLLPNFYGPLVDVSVDAEIREIIDISEVDLHMKLNLVMDIHWEDPRLRFEHVKQENGSHIPNVPRGKGVWTDDSVKGRIWTPEVSIINEKESTDHSTGFVEESLLWYPDGEIVWRINAITTVSCAMSFENFPMDEQNCSILIGSASYGDDEVRLIVRPYLHPVFSSSVTNVKLLGWRVSPLVNNGDGPNRTTFAYELLLRRFVGYYVIGTFFPSALVVFISWLTFWMARDSAGERMALGVTCVLTITTLLISSQASSPKVSYVKAIDIYMGVCFTLVFSTLLQSTLIGYLLRKMRSQESTRRPRESGASSQPPRNFASVVRRVVSGGLEANEEPKIIKFILRCDAWCRFMYPLMFLIFNVAYWTIYMTGSKFDTNKGWNLPETYANVSDGRQ